MARYEMIRDPESVIAGNPVEPWCAQDVLNAVAKLEAVPGIRCRIGNDGLDLWCEIGIPAGRVGSKGNPFSAMMVFAIDDAIDEPSYGLRRDLDEVTDFFLTGALPADLRAVLDKPGI